jgi:prephenate dehydrogenase
MIIQTLTIVGVGLIGGSIGLAAKRRGVATTVVGVGRNPDSLARARAVGAIDEACLELAAGVNCADLAVFCTPVDRIADQVLAVAAGCRQGTLLTDAGSTKATIVRSIQGRLPAGVHFVGSHPLAGSEKRGPDHAHADLFQNRLTVVTPAGLEDAVAAEKIATFWRALGSRVRMMTPEDHDAALALTSHLPHLVASALAGVLPPEMFDLAATGFRDVTRIAAGDPSIWTAIFAQNGPALLAALTTLEDRLAEFRDALEDGQEAAIDTLLTQGKRVRDALGS